MAIAQAVRDSLGLSRVIGRFRLTEILWERFSQAGFGVVQVFSDPGQTGRFMQDLGKKMGATQMRVDPVHLELPVQLFCVFWGQRSGHAKSNQNL